jgi:integrase
MIQARIRKRDGRRVYDVRLRDHDGREYSRTFSTKREAEEFEAAERTDRRRGEWIDPRLAGTRLCELADQWLASNPAKRRRTIDRDREIVGAALAVLGPSRRVVSVTRADVQRLVDHWRAELAPSTVRRMYSALRAMFNYAEASEMIPRSPSRHIRVPAAELVDRPALDVDELTAVADGLGDHGPMVWLGAVLGLRWGEVAGLTVDRIDFLHGSIAITRQLGRDRKLSDPKSLAGRRTLAAPDWLLDELGRPGRTRINCRRSNRSGVCESLGRTVELLGLAPNPMGAGLRRRRPCWAALPRSALGGGVGDGGRRCRRQDRPAPARARQRDADPPGLRPGDG